MIVSLQWNHTHFSLIYTFGTYIINVIRNANAHQTYIIIRTCNVKYYIVVNNPNACRYIGNSFCFMYNVIDNVSYVK